MYNQRFFLLLFPLAKTPCSRVCARGLVGMVGRRVGDKCLVLKGLGSFYPNLGGFWVGSGLLYFRLEGCFFFPFIFLFFPLYTTIMALAHIHSVFPSPAIFPPLITPLPPFSFATSFFLWFSTLVLITGRSHHLTPIFGVVCVCVGLVLLFFLGKYSGNIQQKKSSLLHIETKNKKKRKTNFFF